MKNLIEFGNFFNKLNELLEKEKRGEQIDLDEQIDFILMTGKTDHDEELLDFSKKLKNRKNNLKNLLGD
jgi:hypothetical protein